MKLTLNRFNYCCLLAPPLPQSGPDVVHGAPDLGGGVLLPLPIPVLPGQEVRFQKKTGVCKCGHLATGKTGPTRKLETIFCCQQQS